MNKNILGYTGEITMSFTAALAQNLVEVAMTRHGLADEIFVQLCAHINRNPRQKSVYRAWQLMCLLMDHLPPSGGL